LLHGDGVLDVEEYQKRVVIELHELNDKRAKLNSFLGCTASAQLEPKGRLLLEKQIDAMDSYAGILVDRLQSFGISNLEAAMQIVAMAPVEPPKPDPAEIKMHVNACLTALKDEDGRTKTRELALAATKLQEATMWIDEHMRCA
jgi:hypothetical protein